MADKMNLIEKVMNPTPKGRPDDEEPVEKEEKPVAKEEKPVEKKNPPRFDADDASTIQNALVYNNTKAFESMVEDGIKIQKDDISPSIQELIEKYRGNLISGRRVITNFIGVDYDTFGEFQIVSINKKYPPVYETMKREREKEEKPVEKEKPKDMKEYAASLPLERKAKKELLVMLRAMLAKKKTSLPNLDKKLKADIIALINEHAETKQEDKKPVEPKGRAMTPPSLTKLSVGLRNTLKVRLAQDYETHTYAGVGLAHPIDDILDHLAKLGRQETFWGKNIQEVRTYLRDLTTYVRGASMKAPSSDKSTVEIILDDDWEKIFTA